MKEIGETETIFFIYFSTFTKGIYKNDFFFPSFKVYNVICLFVYIYIDFSFSGYKLDLNVTYGNVFTQNIISK